MTKQQITKKFFDRMRRVAVRLEDTHLTELLSFAESHDLSEASQSEIIKGYIENRIAQAKIDVEICDMGLLDIDSKGEPRCRLRNNPYVDTTNWTENTCIMCRNVRTEMINLEQMLGKRVARKNVGALLTMAKKLVTTEEEIASRDQSLQFFKREIGLRNNDVARLTRQTQTIPSLESKIQNQAQQIETLKASLDSKDTHNTKLSNTLNCFRSYGIVCPKDKGETLGDCEVCDDFLSCSAYGKLIYSET